MMLLHNNEKMKTVYFKPGIKVKDDVFQAMIMTQAYSEKEKSECSQQELNL